MRFNEDAILMGKKFANKVWNIARYIVMKVGADFAPPLTADKAAPIIQKVGKIAAALTENIEKYDFSEAAHLLYDFIWHDFADKYIEETKKREDRETKISLFYLLTTCLKLLHPFMPFVTEEIWSQIPLNQRAGTKKMLLVEEWPS